MTPRIRSEIGQRKSKPVFENYLAKLKARYGTMYRAPLSERFAVDPNPRGGPEKGSPDAPVTVVMFSDFECNYCVRAHARVAGLVKRRANDMRVVYKHFPLEVHAVYAAEVAACGQKQGKFWELADLLFRDNNHLDREKVRGRAEAAGMDMAQLDACLDSGEGRRMVQADIQDGNALGISATPSFFVNGHYVGSLPSGGLESIVDRELDMHGAEH